jgi:hypothetical protein
MLRFEEGSDIGIVVLVVVTKSQGITILLFLMGLFKEHKDLGGLE